MPFIVQHTINGYPRELESRVVDAKQSVEHLRKVADVYGSATAVWRYDTIVFSSLTSADFHRRNFEQLARSLEGVTDEVVVSFMQVYGKTQRNLDLASREAGFTWRDPADRDKHELLGDLIEIATSNAITLTMCSQPQYAGPRVPESSCIDANRLGRIAGHPINAEAKGSRKECRCAKSRDIGDYDTCPHGCVYCYAVRNREVALERYREHDPHGEFLFTTGKEPPSGEQTKQLPLFK